eukprot:TRINITY_DN2895_c0_g1_i1.p1 TRINITY_DN2895_c0_g1~~TRINITY_DN2895_c0_g1_i1.p1  ORF type:complete len:376 (-),score=72.51 TRINITY_DN2895_c0_g1_i1:201-1328(-)
MRLATCLLGSLLVEQASALVPALHRTFCTGRQAPCSHRVCKTSLFAAAATTRVLASLPASLSEEGVFDAVVTLGADKSQELLASELYMMLMASDQLRKSAVGAGLMDKLVAKGLATSPYSTAVLEPEVLGELDTGWQEAIAKWRKKALAVEKYRCTNPQYVAGIYSYMANTCIYQGMPDVANEALTYAGMPPAGPFFVTPGTKLGDGTTATVLNCDRMSAYIAEQILDMDLDAWRKLAGVTNSEGAFASNAAIGLEESNFRQNDESTSHESALRVQDMTLAAVRVALRQLLPKLQAGGQYEGQDLVILASCRRGSQPLQEILLPVNRIKLLLVLDLVPAFTNQDATALLDDAALDCDRGCPVSIPTAALQQARMR